jgi:ubiquinone/menaquinone biosynthesis C-methylase UbiE
MYDWDYAEYTGDIPFNVQLACELAGAGEMLEFACGTGRLTFPIARAGIEITGVDITPAMLAVARQKFDLEPTEVAWRMCFLEGDMRNFDAGKGQYQYVLIPFTSFLHLTTLKDQQAALANAYAHLKPGGHFLADIFMPNVAHLASSVGTNWVKQEKAVQQGDRLLVRWTTTRYDQSTQLLTGNWYYQVYETTGENRLVESYWVPMELRVIFPAEWELLLEQAGFAIVERWGGFNREPFGPGAARMLFLCRK